MKKYIHYCWFGDKPFPKLAEKCLKSWKKYLPDFEIMKWSEENLDLNECPFVKEAYENKKWAFVADYARAKALKEYGGIYFDTDMEVIKNIESLFEHKTFLGVEDTGYVAVGVWYESKKNAFLPSELLKVYQGMDGFNVEKMSEFAIPKLLSNILVDFGFKHGLKKVQVLDKDICIYPRDYFYPYSYHRDNNVFTENTCMIHYYDASWLPKRDQLELKLIHKLGMKWTYRLINLYRLIRLICVKLAKVVLFPLVLYRRYHNYKLQFNDKYMQRIKNTVNAILMEHSDYLVLYNSDWFGITSATKELFDHLIDCGELKRKRDYVVVGNAILESGIQQVVFSSFAIGWKNLVLYLKKKNPNIKIKTFWHGNHSQVLDCYGWERNSEIIELHKLGYIDVMGTCKKSLMEFYQRKGCNAYFITNKVDAKKPQKIEKSDKIRIGLYAAKCDDWRKNMYTQMAAAALIPNVEIDMVPLNESAQKFAKLLNIDLIGEEKPISREKLMERMASNDVTMYVTFSECAPMLPLESFEVGVPCVVGNNHHYFQNDPLEKEIVVKNEDNILDVKNAIENCIQNKEKILKLYKKFKDRNKKNATKNVKEFINM